jgi:hypothetical protein
VDWLRLLLFIGLNVGVWLFARSLIRRLLPQADSGTRLTGTLVVYFYTIIVGLTLMVKINLLSVCVLAGLAGLIGWRLSRRPAAQAELLEKPPHSWIGAVLFFSIAASLAYLLINALLHPRFFHDPMTYQLTFAAEWLQQGKITLVPTPFGDPSQAYAPSNPSLYYLWLMLPLHRDTFAILGQFPFALLALAAVIGLAKLIEIPRPWHLIAPLLLLASPMFREQTASAYSDLALAALFVAALFFWFRAWRTREIPPFIFGSMAWGLMLGTKYNALPLSLLVLPVMAAALVSVGKSSRHWFLVIALALLAIILGGGYWYARNFWLTGSPVYPFRVDLGHWNLIPGVYGRPEMLNWIFHQQGFQAWQETMQTLADRMLLVLFALGMAAITPWLILRRKVRAGMAYLLLLPLLIDRINWWVVPFQVDRFWMPALLLAPLGLAGLTRFRPRLGYLLLALAILDVVAFQPKHLPLPEAPGATRREQALLAWEFGPAWNALAAQPGNFTVAYAGNNIPYPLYGPRLNQRVRYVNVNAQLDNSFNSYAIKYFPLWNTPELAPYRIELDVRGWFSNLVRDQVKWLAVSRISEAELVNLEHDAQGWPTEKFWADSHPEIFTQVFNDAFMKIYRIDLSGQPKWSEQDVSRSRPLDALAAYAESEDLGRRWFPLAQQVIEKYHWQLPTHGPPCIDNW